MKLKKRKFIKIISFSCLALFFQIKGILAATKKIINPNLSKEQKNIMFNEGTERPFTSDLLKEKRKGFYHCANCEINSLHQRQNLIAGLAGPQTLPGAFKTKIDYSFGMERVEYHCASVVCIGHVFNDGPKESGKRFCNNGLCLISNLSNCFKTK